MSSPTLSSPPDSSPQLELRPSSPELRNVVDRFWLMPLDPERVYLVPREFGRRPLVVLGADGLGDASAPGFPTRYSHQWVIPDGSLDLLIRLPYRVDHSTPVPAESGSVYACVLMALRHTIEAAFYVPSSIFGVRFFPGGARDFFPTGIHALSDRATPLDELWGSKGVELVNEASVAVGVAELGAIAERFLLEQKRESGVNLDIVRRSVQALERSHGDLSLDELRSVSGVTERQLERLFKEYVGTSPKRLSRTLRLHYLMKAVRNLDAVDWHELIVILNYCDQPHLIREFREFVGMTPTAFREEMKRHIENKKRLGGGES
jgi:AraC-like DNA-binding protein